MATTVIHRGFTQRAGLFIIRCGKSVPNRSQFTGNPNLPKMKSTDDWTAVTCKACLRTYVRRNGRKGSSEMVDFRSKHTG